MWHVVPAFTVPDGLVPVSIPVIKNVPEVALAALITPAIVQGTAVTLLTDAPVKAVWFVVAFEVAVPKVWVPDWVENIVAFAITFVGACAIVQPSAKVSDEVVVV